MKTKSLLTILYVCATSICFAQETSLIKWTFDRPFENSRLSESSFSANVGIVAIASGTWSSSVVSAGGAENEIGFFSVHGWDFGDTPTAYYLFPDITLPEKYDEIGIKLYLFSDDYGPEAYNLEVSTDNKTSWKLIDIFSINTAENWTQFVANTTTLKDFTKVSFRIRANSVKSLNNGTLSSFSSSGVDNFEIIGKFSTTDLKEIINNGEKIYTNGKGQLVIESTLPFQSIKIYNIAGQVIRQIFNTSFEIVDLNQGMYIIETQIGESKSVRKISVM